MVHLHPRCLDRPLGPRFRVGGPQSPSLSLPLSILSSSCCLSLSNTKISIVCQTGKDCRVDGVKSRWSSRIEPATARSIAESVAPTTAPQDRRHKMTLCLPTVRSDVEERTAEKYLAWKHKMFQPDLRGVIFFVKGLLITMCNEWDKNAIRTQPCRPAWPLKTCVFRHPILL